MNGIISNINTSQEQLNSFGQSVIPLPSKGLLYKNQQSSVIIEPMKTKHERILASMNQSNSLEVMVQVMKECIKFENEFNEMLLGDALYLMIVLRAISLGGEVRFLLTCPKCDTNFYTSVRVPEELKLIELTPEDIPPFYVELPVCKKVIGWRYLKLVDEKIIEQRVKKIAETLGNEFDLRNLVTTVRKAQAIVSIDGKDLSENHNIMEKIHFVDNLVLQDLYILQSAMDEKEFGLDTTVSKSCSNCGETSEFTLGITPEFFRPRVDASRYIRTGISVGDVRKDDVK